MPLDGSAAQQFDQEDVSPGQILEGRYRLLRHIGTGGMGDVFEAEQICLGRRVAIKLLKPEMCHDAVIVRRFLDEAHTACALRHPNVVEIHDVGTDMARPFIVFELLAGETLGAWLEREGRIDLVGLLGMLEPVMRVLAYAHATGVVHRDIKPDNIFLAWTADGVVPKVLDFGLARRESPWDARLTGPRSILGTPAYMAPEQIAGTRDVTAAADQYALGVILFEALTGRLPHEVPDGGSILAAKVTRPPADLGSLRPDLPPAVTNAVMRTLALDPADRFPCIASLRTALVDATRAFVDGTTLASVPTPQPALCGSPGEPRSSAVRVRTNVRRDGNASSRARRATAWRVLALAFGVGLFAAGAARSLRSGVSPPVVTSR